MEFYYTMSLVILPNESMSLPMYPSLSFVSALSIPHSLPNAIDGSELQNKQARAQRPRKNLLRLLSHIRLPIPKASRNHTTWPSHSPLPSTNGISSRM